MMEDSAVAVGGDNDEDDCFIGDTHVRRRRGVRLEPGLTPLPPQLPPCCGTSSPTPR